jgi:dihydrofolate reductase
MIEIVYYVACSLDGYIADRDGGVDWLSMAEAEGEDYGYGGFFAGVDAMLMGGRTYEQVLGFGAWPYGHKRCLVFTRGGLEIAGPAVSLTARSPAEAVAGLRGEGVRRAWMVGGAALAGAFRDAGLITEYLISVLPIVLGDGIRLLPSSERRQPLDLVGTRRYDTGVVKLHYRAAGEG